MGDEISRYKVTLTVKTPTFVGSGKAYSPLDYTKSQEGVTIYNTEKLFDVIIKCNTLEAYERYIIRNEHPKLSEYLRRTPPLNRYIEKCVLYKAETNIPVNGEIRCFMRDADGNPYIPGSSIKGALRTAIISALLQYGSPTWEIKRLKFIKPGHIEVDDSVKGKSKLNIKDYFSRAIMAGISISDTNSVKNKNLVICKKIDISPHGTYKEFDKVFRECLKPDTKLRFVLTVNKHLMKMGFGIEHLKTTINRFNKYYTDTYIKRFYFNGSDKPELERGDIILGGGTGYFSKNINYPLYGYQEGLRKVFNDFVEQRERRENRQNIDCTLRRQHLRDKELGISPHMLKFTQYGVKMLHMGICNLEFEEL